MAISAGDRRSAGAGGIRISSSGDVNRLFSIEVGVSYTTTPPDALAELTEQWSFFFGLRLVMV